MKNFLIFLLTFFALQLGAINRYVSVTGSDANNGTTANLAWRHIQHAINNTPNAATPNNIIVAPGLYCENINYMGKNLTIKSTKGADLTVIQGDGTQSVVVMENVVGNATLTGFTVRGGGGTFKNFFGGFGSSIVGGGILVYYCNTVPPNNKKILLSYLKVTDNTAAHGGGIFVYTAIGATIDHCEVYRNNASVHGGGVFYIGPGSYAAKMTNSLICENTATVAGGGLAIDYSTKLTMQHVTIAGNLAPLGSIMRRSNAGAFFAKNCIFSGSNNNDFYWEGGAPFNSTLDHCCIQNYVPGSGVNIVEVGGNIYSNPQFRPAYDHYQLYSYSPCRNAGISITPALPLDLLGWPRPFGNFSDMGAYEVQNCGDQAGKPADTPDGLDEMSAERSTTGKPKPEFELYPNPATSTVEILFSNEETATGQTLQIFDLMGKLVKTQSITDATTEQILDIADLPKGVYLVKIGEGAGQKLTKM